MDFDELTALFETSDFLYPTSSLSWIDIHVYRRDHTTQVTDRQPSGRQWAQVKGTKGADYSGLFSLILVTSTIFSFI